MNCKFAVFCLVAVCLVQGFQARVAAPESRSINDILENIKLIIQQIKDSIGEITSQLPDLITNLKDKINNIISEIDVDKIVTSIQDKIDAILAGAGVDPSTVRECTDAEKAAVKQLVEDTTSGLATCKRDADDEVEELTQAMEKLKQKASAMIEESTANIKLCIEENGANLVNVGKCLKEHLNEFKADAEKLVQQVKDTIKLANEKLALVPIELAKCVNQVNVEALAKQKDIIDEFRKCVAAHQ